MNKTKKYLAVLSDMLSLVGVDASPVRLKQESVEDLKAAEGWAALSYLRASDNPVKVPPKPQFLNSYPELKYEIATRAT